MPANGSLAQIFVALHPVYAAARDALSLPPLVLSSAWAFANPLDVRAAAGAELPSSLNSLTLSGKNIASSF